MHRHIVVLGIQGAELLGKGDPDEFGRIGEIQQSGEESVVVTPAASEAGTGVGIETDARNQDEADVFLVDGAAPAGVGFEKAKVTPQTIRHALGEEEGKVPVPVDPGKTPPGGATGGVRKTERREIGFALQGQEGEDCVFRGDCGVVLEQGPDAG